MKKSLRKKMLLQFINTAGMATATTGGGMVLFGAAGTLANALMFGGFCVLLLIGLIGCGKNAKEWLDAPKDEEYFLEDKNMDKTVK